jgi:regulator of cell morphogenesis and NO signaling
MTALDIDVNDTLSDLVADNPLRASVFERFQLDYCCHGGTRLADACAERDLDPDAVVAELVSLQPAPSVTWSSLPPAELADHIESTHHAYLHDEMPRLSALAAKVAATHSKRHPELEAIQSAYEELRADFEPHLMKEERVLFPMIRELAEATEAPEFHCGSVRNPIGVMLAEHDRAGELIATLRALTDDYRPPSDACASYRVFFGALARLEADTHLHIHKENNVLFPAVVRLEQQLSR